MDFFGPSSPPTQMEGSPQSFFPNVGQWADIINSLQVDPTVPNRPRPTTEMLLERKRRIVRFWRPRNLRMLDDERVYKMTQPVEDRLDGNEIGGSETLILNDPFILVEKISNMLASQDPIVSVLAKDPGMKRVAQKVKDFLYWWTEEANSRWSSNLNSDLSRDEVYYLALRGWLAGRIMLDPGDADFPWRYDVIDPIHVYPQRGPKGLRWVFHVYKDAKVNVLNDLGWSQEVVDRIEEELASLSDDIDIEVASYYDDTWHVLFINNEEVWSAPHNYGFVPWVMNYSYGPPIRRTDPAWGAVDNPASVAYVDRMARSYPAWWGVSVFQGIKDIYQKMNKLASAIMTEAMKATNPPIVIKTDPNGESEGKTIDTSIGATSYIDKETEDFDTINYGFKGDTLAPLMQILNDARNRGTLPAVMYGEGANYLSGFAVNLLQGGARDVVLPLVKSHQNFRQNLYKCVLRVTAENYPLPISMVETNPQTGLREEFTEITQDEIKNVGYSVKVEYKNILPQDRMAIAQMASMLVDKKLISLDTARGPEFLALQNATLENEKVLGDLAYFDQDVVQAAIPAALSKVDPVLLVLWLQAQQRKQAEMMMQAQAGASPEGGPSGGNQAPAASQMPNNVAGGVQQQTGAPPGAPPQNPNAPV
jgi:hypothetical protein